MGMKHLSDYYDDWNFAEMMWEKYNFNIPDKMYLHRRFNSYDITTLDLFYLPSDYKMWFLSLPDSGIPIRNSYPVCYLVAMDNVIPIKIDPHPCVLIQDPNDLNLVQSKFNSIISVAEHIISTYWRLIQAYYEGEVSNPVFISTITKATKHGWEFVSGVAEFAIPTTKSEYKIIR